MKQSKNLTAEDVKKIVQEEIKPFREEVKAGFFEVRKEFDVFKQEIRDDFASFRSEVMTSIDKIIGMFGNHNEEHEKLEEIHPHNQHATA